MRYTIGAFALAALLLSGASARAQDTPRDGATPSPPEKSPSEVRERVQKSLDQARTLQDEASRHRQEATRLDQEAETKRAEAMRIQSELVVRDQRMAADRLRALSLHRDADEDELLAAAAERSHSELMSRVERLRNDARDLRALAESRRKSIATERDAQRRERLESQITFLADDSDRKDREAMRLEHEAKEAGDRAHRFRDDAQRDRAEAERLEKRIAADKAAVERGAESGVNDPSHGSDKVEH
jgi:hypothetical protein